MNISIADGCKSRWSIDALDGSFDALKYGKDDLNNIPHVGGNACGGGTVELTNMRWPV